MSSLNAIVYVSSAVRLLRKSELENLLVRARQRNQQFGITGLLLYCDGNFMQYIEGEREALRSVFDIIRNDPLHRGMIVMLDKPVEAREFDGWSMAFALAHEEELARLTAAAWTSDVGAGESSSPGGSGRVLLRAFWERQMKSIR